MPTDRRRIQLTVNDDVFRLLALDPKEHGAIQVSAALARYAQHVGWAARTVERTLTRDDWNFFADISNGCADLWDYSETPLSHLLLLKAQVEDGHRLDGAGYKWFGEGEAGDKGIKALLAKLATMTDVHGDAIAAALRHFWANFEDIDLLTDDWWTLAFRTRPRAVAER